jgi:hypothetical protein
MENRSIPDATLLVLQTPFFPTITFDHDGLAVFTFADLTEAQARELLSTPEAELCRKFYRKWRALRRAMEEARLLAKRAPR